MKKLYSIFTAFILMFSFAITSFADTDPTTGDIDTGPGTGPEGTVITAPVATPTGGSYSSSQNVTLAASGAPYICYTIDGADPACNYPDLACTTGTKYTAAIPVADDTTIKAISCYPDDESAISTFNYTISSGGGGGGGGGGGALSTYYLPETMSDSPVSLADRNVDLPSSGIFTREVTLYNTRSGITVFFPLGTEVTYENGDPYTDWITPTAKVLEGALPDDIPGGAGYVFGFSLDGLDDIYFEPEFTVTIPLTEPYYGRTDLLVYYFNESTNEYEMIDPSKVSLSDDGESLIVSLDHITIFVVVDPTIGDGTTVPIGGVTTTPFRDVANHWANEYIEELYDRGIVNGKTADLFAPDSNITRAELTKVVVNTFGLKLKEEYTKTPFGDVRMADWHVNYVMIAYQNGVINGYQDGTFKPNNDVSRAEALKMLLTAAGFEMNGGEENFPDVNSDDWFEKYVAYAQLNKIVNGYKDGTFKPHNSMTRAEIAKVVVMILEMIE